MHFTRNTFHPVSPFTNHRSLQQYSSELQALDYTIHTATWANSLSHHTPQQPMSTHARAGKHAHRAQGKTRPIPPLPTLPDLVSPTRAIPFTPTYSVGAQ